MVAQSWVTVDCDSKYKIVWGETRAHGVPIHEKNKVQNKNLYNYSLPPPTYIFRRMHVGVEMGNLYCASNRKSK